MLGEEEIVWVVLFMEGDSRGALQVYGLLTDVLGGINEARLANITRKKVPELELVKKVRQKLEQRLGQESVFGPRKGVHEKFKVVHHLKQPDVDLGFWYGGMLHGLEFKLLRKGWSFYAGLDEALAYSTWGVNFSWIIHFHRKNFKLAGDYEKWMKYAIQQSGCPSIGYITCTSREQKLVVLPVVPFKTGLDRDLDEIVHKVREKVFKRERRTK